MTCWGVILIAVAFGCRDRDVALTLEDKPAAAAEISDPLPSWRDGPAKRAIVEFVERTTHSGSPDFVPLDRRIAVFDNDGTLSTEQPSSVQLAFAFDRVKQLAPDHPAWRQHQPFKGALEGDVRAIAATGTRGIAELVAATHAGTTTDEFARIVSDWIATARHPRFDRRYPELVYEPMLEVLTYLRARRFKTYIVSGAGVEFIRVWSEHVFGIPPEQVIGSRAAMRYELRRGVPVLMRLPGVDLVDDRAGKPAGIEQAIGRRPIAAFGNSDGDFEMLEWTTSGSGPRLGVLVHHTDQAREWAYDRASPVGRLSHALDEAGRRGWIVADMKRDWSVIFPFERK